MDNITKEAKKQYAEHWKAGGVAVTAYNYVDEDGTLLFQVIREQRKEGKKFYQRQPDGKGGWVNTIKGVKIVPYRLPEVIEAVKQGETVFIVEGEKDAETLAEWGLVATTNPMGAGKWREDFNHYLKGACVVILPDNDEAGNKHVEKTAKSLHGVAKTVKIVRLPVLREHEDVTDWKERYGGTKEALLKLAKEIEEYQPSRSKKKELLPEVIREGERNNVLTSYAGTLRSRGFKEDHILEVLLETNRERCCPPLPENEVYEIAKSISKYRPGGNLPSVKRVAEQAETLEQLWSGKYRWAKHKGSWMKWTGTHWVEIHDSIAIREASKALRDFYARQMEKVTSEALAAKLVNLMDKACTIQELKNILTYTQSAPGIHTNSWDWDKDGYILNVNNGTIDLRTGTFRPHDPNDLCTHLAPVDYDSTAVGRAWEEHIRYAIPDADTRRQLQRDLGVSLIGGTLQEALPIWYGQGANGKSTTARVLQAVLGSYAGTAAPNLLIQKRFAQHPTELADLKGKRLIFTTEVGYGDRLDEVRVKQLTGGDPIKARFMNQNFFEFQRTWTIFLLCNQKPTIIGNDHGIWRRIRLIPWTVIRPFNEQEPQDIIVSRLLEEAPAILRWLLDGLADWYDNRHWIAEKVSAATQEYQSEQDTVTEFIGDCCKKDPDGTVTMKRMYEAYVEWCDLQGYTPLTKRHFENRLSNYGFGKKRGTGGVKHWVGYTLRNSDRELLSNSDFSTKLEIPVTGTIRESLTITPTAAQNSENVEGNTENLDGSKALPVLTTACAQDKNTAVAVCEPAQEQKLIPQNTEIPVSAKTNTCWPAVGGTSYIPACTRPISELEGCITDQEVALDLETTGLDPRKDRICVLSVATKDDYWIVQNPPEDLLRTVVSLPKKIIGHNLAFDIAFLFGALGRRLKLNIFDTMIAAQLIECGRKKEDPQAYFTLEKVAKRYLNITMDKTLQTCDWSRPLTEQHIKYCVNDVQIPLKLYERQNDLLEKNKLTKAAELEFNCVPATAEMELNGFRFDMEGARRLLDRLILPRIAELKPLSAPQILKYFAEQGIELPNTKEATLKTVNHDMARRILEYRGIKKSRDLLESCMEFAKHDGRIYADLFQLGASTGRFTCSNPNLQQIPRDKEFRKLFIPSDGHLLVGGDWSAIELRIMAKLSNDRTMIEAFTKGIDLHRLTASKISGKAPDQITSAERNMAKAVNFGLLYGMGAEGLQIYARNNFGTNMTLEEAEKARQVFFETYSSIKDRYHKRISNTPERTYYFPEGPQPAMYTRSLSGRVRIVGKEDNGRIQFTTAVNHPDQGTGVDILKAALALLYNETDYRLLLPVHDEILIEVPEEEAEHAKEVLNDIMVRAGSRFIAPVPVEAEVKSGRSWGECH